ncbi:hypothetical protein H2200_012867 [Cladophialophora chaetospira]|uniref:RRM domain-containing protein n=1 Tax=Cladophialophora chaetospira TaxID=386627 RepID=A0AA39CBY3_9EURO|nr:hypothetical protein H2200_012867 [Cladophialophora chaetospira]
MSSRGRSAGVLPVNAATRKNAAAQSIAKSSQRTPAPRLRLIIRRLPPGLTETEFWATLGDEWRLGNGKVEWAAYKDGKISRDPAKPSRPARAYLKVKEQSLLDVLSKVVKESSFQDSRNTTKDPCLLGPPSLEFAPYNKTPSGRIRQDGRQGTIDQDQEFIDFLQSLTEPITKAGANGADSGDSKPEAVTTTPLVQYIKEKKANKAKEAAQAKAAKSASKEVKPTKNERPPTVIIKGKASSTAAEKDKDKERVAKATQDAVKAVQKSVAAAQGKQTSVATKIETKQQAAKETPSPAQSQSTEPAKPDRVRAPRDNARGAARMLQRDLGLLAKGNASSRTPKGSTSTTSPTAQTGTSPAVKVSLPSSTSKGPEPTASQQKPSTPATPTTPAAPPTGPRASRTPSTATSSSAKQAPTAPSAIQAAPAQSQPQPQRVKPQPSPPQPSAGAKSAFLKHANPSQGITEDLLREAFKPFGTITRCEIDKKKGLGYIDFAEHEALKKAMAASPVKIANGQVVVLENKSLHGKKGGTTPAASKTAPSPAASPALAKVTTTPAPVVNLPKAAPSVVPPVTQEAATQGQTPATPTTPSVPADPSSPATASATPPTAPRGASRGGNRGGGGRNVSRGGAVGQAQGGRHAFRGGRGNFRGGGRVGANASASASAAGGGESSAASGSGNASAGASDMPTPAPAPAVAKDEVKKA